jgi:hypothetical protein
MRKTYLVFHNMGAAESGGKGWGNNVDIVKH